MKMFRVFSLIAVTAIAMTGCASVREGTSVKGLEVPIEKVAIRFEADVREGGYKVVSSDELKKWTDANRKMTVIDVLPAEERAALGHIGSSVNAPLPKTEKEITPADRQNLIAAAGPDKDRLIVVYCGFVGCRRSHHGAKILTENGYTNVYRNPGGIVGWKESGYPLTK